MIPDEQIVAGFKFKNPDSVQVFEILSVDDNIVNITFEGMKKPFPTTKDNFKLCFKRKIWIPLNEQNHN